MKKSRYKLASPITVNEEVPQDKQTFWSEYWYYFPRVGISPSSLFDSIVLAIATVFTAIIYTVMYVIYMSLSILMRSLRR